MKVKLPANLQETCADVVRGQSCANYSKTSGKCKRRWSGRSPCVPCNVWRKRPKHWIKGGDE